MLERKQIIITFTAYMYVKDSVLLCYALGCNTSDLQTSEAKGTMFLQNVWNQLTSGAAAHPRRTESSTTLPRKPQD